jgi:hypothetical protein
MMIDKDALPSFLTEDLKHNVGTRVRTKRYKVLFLFRHFQSYQYWNKRARKYISDLLRSKEESKATMLK